MDSDLDVTMIQLEDGVLHVVLTVPTGAGSSRSLPCRKRKTVALTLCLPAHSGEAYDATTRLLQTLIARAHDELQAMNAERALHNLPAYPPLTQAWTMRKSRHVFVASFASLTYSEELQT
jgi:hypothetical protein